MSTFTADLGRTTAQVRVRSAPFGSYTATLVEHGPQGIDTPLPAITGPPDRSFLIVVVAGEVQLRHSDHRATLHRRESALILGTEHLTYASGGAGSSVLCSVPATTLGLSMVPPSMPFVITRAAAAAPSAVGALLVDLLRNDGRRHPRTVRHEIAGVLHGMVPDIATVIALEARHGWDRRRQRLEALRYVAAHYTEPDLDPATVAAHLGISLRGLQRLFESDGGMTQHIRRLRARHAVTRLRDPRFASVSAADIATLCGFGSVLAMRRTVRDLTGQGLADLRASAHPHARRDA